MASESFVDEVAVGIFGDGVSFEGLEDWATVAVFKDGIVSEAVSDEHDKMFVDEELSSFLLDGATEDAVELLDDPVVVGLIKQ